MSSPDNMSASTAKQGLKDRLWTRAKSLHLRMQHKAWWRIEVALVVAALFFGLFSGILGHFNQLAKEEELAATYQTRVALVAAEDLKPGETLTKAKITTLRVLANTLTANHLSPKNIELILGRQIGIELKKNDPFLLSAIQGASELNGIASQIPPGKRLFTLTIADSAANNGFIKPNDHVDIMTHIQLPQRGVTTFTLLQDTTLISVGRTTIGGRAGSEPASNVSFFIDAKDAEMLAFAQQRGTFSLSLRNPSDVITAPSSHGIDLDDFLDNERVHAASGGGKLKVFEKGVSLNGKG